MANEMLCLGLEATPHPQACSSMKTAGLELIRMVFLKREEYLCGSMR